jgi:hypothetical protein
MSSMYGASGSMPTGPDASRVTPLINRAVEIIKELTQKKDPVMANKRIKLLLDEIRSVKKS